jgi:transketolase
VIEIHGHNVAEILAALDCANEIHGRPVVIIARTTKGKGVSYMENQPAWHGGIPDEKQFQAALCELEERANAWRA